MGKPKMMLLIGHKTIDDSMLFVIIIVEIIAFHRSYIQDTQPNVIIYFGKYRKKKSNQIKCYIMKMLIKR